MQAFQGLAWDVARDVARDELQQLLTVTLAQLCAAFEYRNSPNSSLTVL